MHILEAVDTINIFLSALKVPNQVSISSGCCERPLNKLETSRRLEFSGHTAGNVSHVYGIDATLLPGDDKVTLMA